MRTVSGSSAIIVAVLLTGCGAASNPDSRTANNPEAARAAVVAASEAYVSGWLKGDADGLAGQLASDVVISEVKQPDIRGLDAARKAFRDILSTNKVTRLDVRREPVVANGDLALDAGEYDETVAVQGQAAPLNVAGRYMIVWQRQADGAWRILRFMAVDRPSATQP